MATLTPIQAATQLLLHLDGDFLDTGARKTKGLVASSGGSGTMSAGASKFGTQAYDLSAPSTATGMSWQSLSIPSWSTPHMYEGFFYVRAYGDRYLFRVDPTAADCYLDPTGYINVRFFGQSGTAARIMKSRTVVALNTWVHVRIVLIPNAYDAQRPLRMMFVDGVLHDSDSDSNTAYTQANNGWISLGHRLNSNLSSFDGRANEFLFVSGMILDDVSRVDPPAAVLPDTAGADPLYSNTLLLLHCDGTNGGTTFSDSSSYAHTPVVSGGVTTVTSDKVFGSASISFNNGSLTYTSSALDELGTSDFEVEFYYKTSVGGSIPVLQIGGASNYLRIGFDNGPILTFYRSTLGAHNVSSGSSSIRAKALSVNTWYHVRLARIGTDVLMWADGNLVAVAKHGLAAGTIPVTLGAALLVGAIDEFRLTKGLRTPVNFTPPTAKYGDVPASDWKATSNPVSIINGASKAGSASFKSVLPALFVKDTNYGGKGRITGTVKVKGAPSYAVKREVRLIRDKDGACIRATWSDPATGAYEFRYVDETQRYTILTYDYTHDKRAVVADNIQPELM